MIFQRAAIREFTHTAVGVFVALFAILMTTQLIRLLGDAAGGKLASEAVIALLGFRGALRDFDDYSADSSAGRCGGRKTRI